VGEPGRPDRAASPSTRCRRRASGGGGRSSSPAIRCRRGI